VRLVSFYSWTACITPCQKDGEIWHYQYDTTNKNLFEFVLNEVNINSGRIQWNIQDSIAVLSNNFAFWLYFLWNVRQAALPCVHSKCPAFIWSTKSGQGIQVPGQHSTAENTDTCTQVPDKLFTKGPLREVQQKVRRVKRILLRGKTECSTEAIIKARLSQNTFLEFELFGFHFQVFAFCG
jgi:hypothetical protein